MCKLTHLLAILALLAVVNLNVVTAGAECRNNNWQSVGPYQNSFFCVNECKAFCMKRYKTDNYRCDRGPSGVSSPDAQCQCCGNR